MTLLLHGSHAAVKMDLRLVERSPALEFGTYRPRPRVILVDHWSRGFVVWSSNHAHRAWAEGGMFVVSESIWTQCSDMNNCTEESELYWVSLTETNTTKHNFSLFFVLISFYFVLLSRWYILLTEQNSPMNGVAFCLVGIPPNVQTEVSLISWYTSFIFNLYIIYLYIFVISIYL